MFYLPTAVDLQQSFKGLTLSLWKIQQTQIDSRPCRSIEDLKQTLEISYALRRFSKL